MPRRVLSVLMLSFIFVCALLFVVGATRAAAVQADLPEQVHYPAACSPAIIVTSTLDSGVGSLRQAIAEVCTGGAITFDGDLTITLATELVISRSVTLDGETHAVKVSGNHVTRVFNVTGGHVTFAHLTIADGNVQTTDCGSGLSAICGGGIMLQNNGVVVTVTQSALISNTATDWGGAILNMDGVLMVINSTLSGNSANVGGGINNRAGAMTVMNSTLSGNSALYGGGLSAMSRLVYCTPFPDVKVINSTFSGNSATIWGGAIYNSYGSLEITSSTITTNTAPTGGGVHSYNDLMTCTYVGRTIIAGNSGNDVSANATAQRFSSRGYNVIGTAGANVDFNLDFKQTQDVTNVVAPLLAPLADNSGGTWTHALLVGSPALDRGSAACPVADQRGVARPQGAACDSGAYEAEQHTLLIHTAGNGHGIVTPTVGSHFYLSGTATLVPITATVGVGSLFTGWSGDLTGDNNPTEILVNADKAVTATFTLQTFAITPTAGANGSITPATSQMVNYGESITFTIAADPGYHVTAVSVDGVSQGPIGSYTFQNVTATHTITAAFALNPPIGLTVSTDSPTVLGDMTTLTATVTGGLNVTYQWDFGDGQTGGGSTVTHTFASASRYTALVTATNNAGYLSAATLITVTNQPPVADAGTDQNVYARALVTLNGASSADPDGHLPLAYNWTQTGGAAVAFTPNLSVTTFTAPGASAVLTFTLVVTDARGAVSVSDDVTITIKTYSVYLPLIAKN